MRLIMRKKPSKLVNILFAVVAVAFGVYYLCLGFAVRFSQSLMWVWPVMIAFLLLRHVLVARMRKTGRPSPIPHILLKLFHIALAVLFVLLKVVEAVIFKAGCTSAPEGLDYIIVLGAKVNGTTPGGALRNRI